MKTIREMSEITGVSKTAIYNLIKNRGIPTVKVKGLTHLDEKGVSLVLAHYSIFQHDTIKDIIQDSTFSSDAESNSINIGSQSKNTNIINILEKQLDEKQEIIRGLLKALENEQQLRAVPLIAETKSPEKTPRRSFWNRFLKRSVS